MSAETVYQHYPYDFGKNVATAWKSSHMERFKQTLNQGEFERFSLLSPDQLNNVLAKAYISQQTEVVEHDDWDEVVSTRTEYDDRVLAAYLSVLNDGRSMTDCAADFEVAELDIETLAGNMPNLLAESLPAVVRYDHLVGAAALQKVVLVEGESDDFSIRVVAKGVDTATVMPRAGNSVASIEHVDRELEVVRPVSIDTYSQNGKPPVPEARKELGARAMVLVVELFGQDVRSLRLSPDDGDLVSQVILTGLGEYAGTEEKKEVYDEWLQKIMQGASLKAIVESSQPPAARHDITNLLVRIRSKFSYEDFDRDVALSTLQWRVIQRRNPGLDASLIMPEPPQLVGLSKYRRRRSKTDLPGKRESVVDKDNEKHVYSAAETIGFMIVDGDEWQTKAICAQTDPEIFFPEKGGSTREAKIVCRGCEVASDCLQYALDNDERFGVWGGLSERERRKLKEGIEAADKLHSSMTIQTADY